MKSLIEVLQKAHNWFLSALFPSRCLVCGAEGPYLCASHQDFEPAPPSKVSFKYLDRVYASAKYYDPVAEKVIKCFKFQGFEQLADILVQKIAQNTPKDLWKDVTVIPIPLHWTRNFWRGFNQAEIITQGLQKHIPKLQVSQNLKRVKRTSQQARLGKKERAQNLKNAFEWKKDAPIPRKVILIDDVVASGATLDEAAKVLKENGVMRVEAMVFARGGK